VLTSYPYAKCMLVRVWAGECAPGSCRNHASSVACLPSVHLKDLRMNLGRGVSREAGRTRDAEVRRGQRVSESRSGSGPAEAARRLRRRREPENLHSTLGVEIERMVAVLLRRFGPRGVVEAISFRRAHPTRNHIVRLRCDSELPNPAQTTTATSATGVQEQP